MKKTFVTLLCILCIVTTLFSITAFASSWYAFDLETKGTVADRGHPREKTDYNNADVSPTSGSYYGNGARYFLTKSDSDSVAGVMASGYTDRFDLVAFTISYKPVYKCPGNYRMCIYSYTTSTSYSVHVVGNWAP